MKQALLIAAVVLIGGTLIFLFWFHGADAEGSTFLLNAEASDGFLGTLAAKLRTEQAERDLLKADPIYQGNEEQFWITANEMPTFMAQLEVAKAAVPSNLELPYTSDKLPLAPDVAKDQWGRPFCVTGDADTLIILSTGGANLNLKCRSQMKTEKMVHLPRMKTFKTQSGYYALIVDRK